MHPRPNPMRMAGVALAFAFVFTVAISAQDAAEGVPSFRSSTELVQVDVLVTKHGKAAKALTRDDFELYDNGQLQTISVFSVHDQDAPPPAPRLKLPEGVVSNRPFSSGSQPVSTTVILLDAQNTDPEAQSRAAQDMLGNLQKLAPGELMAFYMLTTRLRVMQEFTDDREALRATLEKLKAGQPANQLDDLLDGASGSAAATTQENAIQRRVDGLSDAFETIARDLRGLPGRKKVIWISAALPVTLSQTVTMLNGNTYHEFHDYSGQVYRPVKSLNAANIALYPVDPRGIPVSPDGPGSLTDPNITSMINLAHRTGGKAFYNFNPVQGALVDVINEAVADSDVSYTLGFYPAASERAGTNHSIKVKVKGDRSFDFTDVRYRLNYEAEQPPPPHTRKEHDQMLDTWVLDSLNAMDVPVYAKLEPAEGRPGYFNVAVRLDIRGLRLELKNGGYTGSIDLAVVPDGGRKPKGLHQVLSINLSPSAYAAALENGLSVTNQLAGWKENGKELARQFQVVVMDNVTLKAGSLRLPIPAK